MPEEAKCQLVINMPRAQAWEKLKDLSLAHNYVPGLVKTEITTAQLSGVGASRKVYQTQTRGIDETVTEWVDGSGFLIRLHRGEKGAPPPFKEAWFRYWLEEGEQPGTTLLSTSLIYNISMGGFGRWLEKTFLGKVFKTVIRDVAISMKQFYESGQPVTPAILKQLKADFKKSR